jgi:hypothetical protein
VSGLALHLDQNRQTGKPTALTINGEGLHAGLIISSFSFSCFPWMEQQYHTTRGADAKPPMNRPIKALILSFSLAGQSPQSSSSAI